MISCHGRFLRDNQEDNTRMVRTIALALASAAEHARAQNIPSYTLVVLSRKTARRLMGIKHIQVVGLGKVLSKLVEGRLAQLSVTKDHWEMWAERWTCSLC